MDIWSSKVTAVSTQTPKSFTTAEGLMFFPIRMKYDCPQLSLLIITLAPETSKIEPKSYAIIPCLCIQVLACYKHSNFFKVNVADLADTQLRAHTVFASNNNAASSILCGRPTTSFLTATILIYRYWSWNYRGRWHQTYSPMHPC